ncbi:MAG TPA: septation protein A [Gammaproteobacteria bacterium]|jgi:intracellular septation protein
MQLLIDFLPIIVFFGTYKVAGMYAATAAIIIAMALQIGIQWLRTRTVNKMLLTSGILVAFFGGVTLLLRDPIFIQWKPTIVNLLFAAAFLGSRFIGEKTLIERIMGHAIELDTATWRQLNGLWVGNFAFLAAANLYVVYNFDEATWVNFKLFGMLGLTLAMVLIQAVWITVKTAGREHDERTDQASK